MVTTTVLKRATVRPPKWSVTRSTSDATVTTTVLKKAPLRKKLFLSNILAAKITMGTSRANISHTKEKLLSLTTNLPLLLFRSTVLRMLKNTRSDATLLPETSSSMIAIASDPSFLRSSTVDRLPLPHKYAHEQPPLVQHSIFQKKKTAFLV